MARIASMYQLYVLNRARLLELRQTPGARIDYPDADKTIRHSIETYGEQGKAAHGPVTPKASNARD